MNHSSKKYSATSDLLVLDVLTKLDMLTDFLIMKNQQIEGCSVYTCIY